MNFRPATQQDAEKLTELTFAAKSYWQYPQEYLELWRKDLTITPEYLEKSTTVVAENQKQLLGYFSIVFEEEYPAGKFFLDNLFVNPTVIRQGIGAKLLQTAFEWCKAENVGELYVVSDPHAQEFYQTYGFEYLSERPTSILGRTLPLLVYSLEKQH
ncbi:GNAT family N-acetyltransferase [Enterococcus sp. LJL90]